MSIIADTEETYTTVIMKEFNAFHWILEGLQSSKSKSNLKWIVKIDDDVIVNFQNFKKLLKKFENEIDNERLICRQIHPYPIRRSSSKWYMPRHIYPEKRYPTYCYGPMYIWTLPAVKKTYNLFIRELKNSFVWLEDVYLTGKS